MPNASKRKGSTWESSIVDYLRAHGAPHAERRSLNGARDRGDIAGIPGLVIEAKAERTPRIAEWLAEAEAERINDNADIAVVWVKRFGRVNAAAGHVIMTPDTLIKLLRWGALVDVEATS